MGYNILFYACAGCLIGALSAIISKLISSNQKQKLVNVIVFAVLFGTFFAVSKQMKLQGKVRAYFQPEYRVVMAIEEEMKDVFELARAKGQILGKSTDEIRSYFRKLTAAGLKRLPDEWIIRWNDIRIELAEISKSSCSAFWTGKVDEKEFLSAMNGLDENDMRDWAKLTSLAAKLELEQSAFSPVTQDDLIKGLESVKYTLAHNEQDRFMEVLKSGLSASDEDSCWVMKKMMNGARELSKDESVKFLRSLTAQL